MVYADLLKCTCRDSVECLAVAEARRDLRARFEEWLNQFDADQLTLYVQLALERGEGPR
jgi:hypothetical protein